jgi:hypothetical protein
MRLDKKVTTKDAPGQVSLEKVVILAKSVTAARLAAQDKRKDYKSMPVNAILAR